MKGDSNSRLRRLEVLAAFIIVFVASSTFIVAAIAALGHVTLLQSIPASVRNPAGLGVVGTCAVLDIRSTARRSYCVLTLRRQAPQGLEHILDVRATVAVWAADAGTIFSTYRVSAASWGALALVSLGLGAWWSGAIYGLILAGALSLLALTSTDESQAGSGRWFRYLPTVQRAAGGIQIGCACWLVVG